MTLACPGRWIWKPPLTSAIASTGWAATLFSGEAELRPNRARLFATDITGSGTNITLTYRGRYDFLRDDFYQFGTRITFTGKEPIIMDLWPAPSRVSTQKPPTVRALTSKVCAWPREARPPPMSPFGPDRPGDQPQLRFDCASVELHQSRGHESPPGNRPYLGRPSNWIFMAAESGASKVPAADSCL